MFILMMSYMYMVGLHGISVTELLVERMDIWWLCCADISGGGFDTLFCFVVDVFIEWICGLK